MTELIFDAALGLDIPTLIEPSLSLVLSTRQPGAGGPLVSTGRCLSQLQTAWSELEARVGGAALYQSHGWCKAWVDACAAIGKPVDARIVTVWEEGRLVLLWPLCVRRLGPIGILHALAEPATQYCGLLVEASPSAAQWVALAWKHVQAEPGVDFVHLHNVRSDSALADFTAHHLGTAILSQNVAPFLRLGPSGEGAEGEGRPKLRSGKSVNALKRHWRNLEKLGPVEFQLVPRCRHVAAVAEALEMKRAWLVERGAVSAGYDHPANEATIFETARRGRFLVTRLAVGGKTAAVEVGLFDRGTYCSLIQSYDLRLASHAPGRLLLWKLLSGPDLGIATFDFLPPAHPHKMEWTTSAVTVTDYAAPLNLKGRIAAFYLREGKSLLKRMFAALPRPLRIRLLGWAHRFY